MGEVSLVIGVASRMSSTLTAAPADPRSSTRTMSARPAWQGSCSSRAIRFSVADLGRCPPDSSRVYPAACGRGLLLVAYGCTDAKLWQPMLVLVSQGFP